MWPGEVAVSDRPCLQCGIPHVRTVAWLASLHLLLIIVISHLNCVGSLTLAVWATVGVDTLDCVLDSPAFWLAPASTLVALLRRSLLGGICLCLGWVGVIIGGAGGGTRVAVLGARTLVAVGVGSPDSALDLPGFPRSSTSLVSMTLGGFLQRLTRGGACLSTA